ncbi:MAG: hypothetical protein MZV64_23395 [Ignavibacteriales bacterium]|nr:hypothetical protein [Ignavibacteriales bacterium]
MSCRTSAASNSEEPALFTELTERELDVLRLIANGHDQQPDRGEAGHQREHGQGACEQHPEQTSPGRPHPGGCLRLAEGIVNREQMK